MNPISGEISSRACAPGSLDLLWRRAVPRSPEYLIPIGIFWLQFTIHMIDQVIYMQYVCIYIIYIYT